MTDCLNHIICNNKGDIHYHNLCYPCFMFFGKWRGDTGELEQKDDDSCENCSFICIIKRVVMINRRSFKSTDSR